jgi:hypothetical protein
MQIKMDTQMEQQKFLVKSHQMNMFHQQQLGIATMQIQDPNINPGRTEICDGDKDNNCNGQTDEGNVCGYASTFAKSIGGSLTDIAFSIIQSSDGGYVVAGRTQSFGAGGC